MFKKIKKFIFKSFLAISLIIVFSMFFTSPVDAASLSLSPSSSNTSVGNIVSVKIIVNTVNKYINNADAVIQFPTDLLEVVSISKASSVFSMWVEEPIFSNSTGKITFNGGVANPGFNGSNGIITTITFKAKKKGTASIIFTDGAVRENDGLGTNILISKNPGTIQIGAPKEIEIPITVDEKSSIPQKPVIISDTHPDQDQWYSNNTATFSWKIPTGITSLQTLLNKIPDSSPIITYDNSVSQKTLNNLSDGILYLHLRFFNSAGGSPIAHYKVKIDKTPPKSFTPTTRVYNNQSLIKLNAEDETSGVDYYTIKIDNNPIIKVGKNELVNNEYILPVQVEGNHNVVVVAYDKAGNNTTSNLIYNSRAISVPIISLSSSEIMNGESVVILGKTDYPNKQVEVTLEMEGKEINKYSQTISTDGTFSITTDKLKTNGLISIYAETIFSSTVKSGSSEKIYLKVNQTKIAKYTLAIFYPLLYLILILSLLLIIMFLLYFGWHKYFGLKKKVKMESKKTIEEVHKAMLLLKEELSDQLKSLEKIKIDRNLNEKEEVIFNEIQKNIEGVDDFIEKKLKKLI